MPKETTHSAKKSPSNWAGAIEQFRFNTHSTDQPLCPVVLSVPKNQGERPERALVMGEKLADILRVLLNAWTYKNLKLRSKVKGPVRGRPPSDDFGAGVYTSTKRKLN
jgi:hypothetical protein